MNLLDLQTSLPSLIFALWHQAQPIIFFNPFLTTHAGLTLPAEPTLAEIREVYEDWPLIETLAGRYVGIDFTDLRQVDGQRYNSRTGPGTFERIVQEFRSTRGK